MSAKTQIGPAGKLFDAECYALAVYFLSGEGDAIDEKKAESLARHIQQACEDWLGSPEIYMNEVNPS